jgi:hypothetical protein
MQPGVRDIEFSAAALQGESSAYFPEWPEANFCFPVFVCMGQLMSVLLPVLLSLRGEHEISVPQRQLLDLSEMRVEY